MTRSRVESILKVIGRRIRAEMLRDFRPDCCIATARAVTRTLERVGVECEAVPTAAFAFNAEYRRRVMAGERPPEGRDELHEWCAQTGAYSVGAAPGMVAGPGFNGHVVVWVPRADALFDGSLDQFARPSKGLKLPGAAAFEYPGAGTALRRGQMVEIDLPDGGVLAYKGIGDESFRRRSPDWTRTARTDRVVGELVRAIKAAR